MHPRLTIRRAHPTAPRRSHPSPGLQPQNDRQSPLGIERNQVGRGQSHPNGRRRPGHSPAPPFSFTAREATRLRWPGHRRRADSRPRLRLLHGQSRVLFLVQAAFLLELHPQLLHPAAASRSAASGSFRRVSRETGADRLQPPGSCACAVWADQPVTRSDAPAGNRGDPRAEDSSHPIQAGSEGLLFQTASFFS